MISTSPVSQAGVGKSLTRGNGETLLPPKEEESRLKTAAGYPERAKVPSDRQGWEKSFPGYNPPLYESTKVIAQDPSCNPKGSAHPANLAPDQFRELYQSGKLSGWVGEYGLDSESGRPLNPFGRTGIAGRGLLFKWGPNKAADAIVTRIGPESGKLEILLILRASGEWALPGGFLNPDESSREAAVRELREETGLSVDFSNARRTFSGLVIDPRMTDNAWIESEAYHLHLQGAGADVCGSDDAQDADWHVVTPELIDSLYASHPEMVRMALKGFTDNRNG